MKGRRRWVFPVLALVGCVSRSGASREPGEPYTPGGHTVFVTGEVRLPDTYRPVVGFRVTASCSCSPGDVVAFGDEQGRFVLGDLPEGLHRLEFEFVDWPRKVRGRVYLGEGEHMEVHVYPEPDPWRVPDGGCQNPLRRTAEWVYVFDEPGYDRNLIEGATQYGYARGIQRNGESGDGGAYSLFDDTCGDLLLGQPFQHRRL